MLSIRLSRPWGRGILKSQLWVKGLEFRGLGFRGLGFRGLGLILGSFPKLGVLFFGVPIIRIVVIWGPLVGVPYFGKLPLCPIPLNPT